MQLVLSTNNLKQHKNNSDENSIQHAPGHFFFRLFALAQKIQMISPNG
jgi:hypothetical protein